MGKIVDISKHQPCNKIDWDTFSKNVDLLIMRVQYGSSVPDSEYKNHVDCAKMHNIPFMTYAFPEFISVDDARVEARNAVSRQDSASLSTIIDIEPEYDKQGNPTGITKLSQSVRLDGIKAYVDELRKHGIKKVGAYIDQRVYESWGINTILNIFDWTWVPAYGVDNGQPNKKPKYACDLWQYTSVGKLPGYNDNLDLSVLNGSKSLDWFLGNVAHVSSNGVIQRVRALCPNDIRRAPSHQATYVRDTVVGEEFEVYKREGDWHCVGGDATGEYWIDGNGGANLSWINNPNVKQAQPVYYIVKQGDTVSKIASANGVTVQAIKDLNHMLDVNKIYVGQKLQLK